MGERPQRRLPSVGWGRHSKPVPLWEVLSGGLSACARRWAQFRVGLVAWGMESRKESLAIKKISPRPL